ncbi:MAG: hypothetical protein PHW82_08445 [Bacteroidales bacterium]|nr:hypothetical protein [Bacteroidales bacterium]
MKKKFAVDYQNVLDYSGTVNLQTEEFETETTYDALNRPISITQPDSTVITNIYNKGGLLEQVKEGTTSYISEINYNARGQRTEVYYGNGSKTVYTYDDENFRLERLLTTRDSGNDILMDLNYTYDSVGNIIQITNDAEREHYFDNTVVSPTATYEYDALYRLTEATGRELTSLQLPSNTDFVNNIPVPNTGTNAMQTYTQQYAYDEIGNITQMKSVGDWTRDYIYDTSTNQLLRHTGSTNVYTYDEHGNMLTMPHLSSMVWDNKDQLVSAGNGTVTSYYNYDVQGERSRKIVVKPGGIVEERYYIGGYEVYRKYISNSLDKERETVHIMDDRDRFAIIDTLTVENGTTLTTPVETIRYQYSNHLGSACLELDGSADIISYEEYHPFGTTSYRSGRNEVDVSLKRYKYVGKERDEETGLYYYGARYYAAWIARFVSVDPLQHEYPQYTPYQYAGNKPITYIDLDGLEELVFTEKFLRKTVVERMIIEQSPFLKNIFNKISDHEKLNSQKIYFVTFKSDEQNLNGVTISNFEDRALYLDKYNKLSDKEKRNLTSEQQNSVKSCKTFFAEYGIPYRVILNDIKQGKDVWIVGLNENSKNLITESKVIMTIMHEIVAHLIPDLVETSKTNNTDIVDDHDLFYNLTSHLDLFQKYAIDFLKGYSMSYEEIPEDSPAGIIKQEIEKAVDAFYDEAKNKLYEAGKESY